MSNAMDKFSELKAAAAKYSVALNAHRENPTDKGALYAWDEATTEFSRAINNDEIDIIIALLAELEAKTKHAADMERVVAAAKCDDELWDAMAHRLKTLEAKLATPVRLQSPWVDKVGNRWLLEGTTADAIRASGFAVTVEGDE
ncbi:hypothetical protein HL670_03929 [Serratia plymuthica]|uniref:hypothetical protein n=1 Tax=Serratia plymuthica TaxID=82996 RepID=UPI0003464145|nr:hypothetical protein [Serratia plymuthica]QJW57032.1 hypothetical protein HL670_03929 [Serratia plymuthica]